MTDTNTDRDTSGVSHPKHPAYDTDEAADRRPAACPICGQTGGFDGLGEREDTVERVRAGVRTELAVTYAAFHCPECDGRFETLEESVQTDIEVISA